MKAIVYQATAIRALIRHANKAKLIRSKIAQYAAILPRRPATSRL